MATAEAHGLNLITAVLIPLCSKGFYMDHRIPIPKYQTDKLTRIMFAMPKQQPRIPLKHRKMLVTNTHISPVT